MDAKIRFLFSLKLETVKAERQERQNAAWNVRKVGDLGNPVVFKGTWRGDVVG